MSDLPDDRYWLFEGSGVYVGEHLWLRSDFENNGDTYFALTRFQVVSIKYGDDDGIEQLVLVTDNGEEVTVSGEEYFHEFTSYEPGMPIPLI